MAKWISAANGVCHTIETAYKDEKVVESIDWTILVLRGPHHTPEEANDVARRLAVLMNHGQTLLVHANDMASEGIAFYEQDGDGPTAIMRDPADTIMTLMTDLGIDEVNEETSLQGVFCFE